MKSIACQRAGALALVTTFLLVQLTGLLHLATQRHAVCGEHGELVHVGEAQAAPPCAERPAGPRGLALEDALAPVHHTHCGLLPAVQPRDLDAHGALARTLAPPRVRAASPPRLPGARASVPLLLQATKLSPPA